MTPAQPARRFFFLLLTASAVFMVLVVRPLATSLFLATVLAVVLWPTHKKLTAKFGKRPAVASGVVVLGVVLLLVAPVVGLSAFIVTEASEGLKFVSEQVRSDGVTKLVKKLPEPFEKLAMEVISQIPEADESGGAWEKEAGKKESGQKDTGQREAGQKDAGQKEAEQQGPPSEADQQAADQKSVDQAKAVGGKAVAAVSAAAKATGSLLFQATMMMIALYFLFLHGKELVAWLDGVLPLPEGQTRELLTEFKTVSYSVVVSTVVTSAVQALAALIGYFIASVPHPLFFASLTFFVAFIPAIGAASVCLVAAVILLTMGHPYMAIFLAIWGLVVVGLVDNLIKPLLIRSGMKMSGAIVFFSLIGGLSAFGTPGLIIGPLVVALFMALLRIYERDYKKPAPR